MRLLSALVALSLFVNTALLPLAHADDNPRTEELEQTLRVMRDGYPTYLDRSFTNMVRGYFLWRLEDYSKLLRYQGDIALERIALLAEWESRWQKARAEFLVNGGTEYEELAVELRSLVAYTEREAGVARILKNDHERTLAAWKNRCGEETLKYPYSFFDPNGLFPIDDVDNSTHVGAYTIGIHVTMSGDGQVMPGAEGGYSETDSAIISGLTAVGYYAATSLLAGTTTGATLGSSLGPVGAAVGALIGLVVTGIIGSARMAKELNHQWDLIAEMRKVQQNALAAIAARAKSSIDTECKTTLAFKIEGDDADGSKSLGQISTIVDRYEEYAKALEAEMHKQYMDLKIELADRFRYLEEIYFPQLQADYLGLVERQFENEIKLDEDARAFARDKLAPRVRNIRNAKGVSAGATHRDDLWNMVLLGDAQLFKADGFYLTTTERDRIRPTKWTDAVDRLAEFYGDEQ